MDQSAYDALSPAERASHDAAARAQEEAEQARLPYKWTQALDHVAVSLPLEQGTKARMLDVSIKKRGIRVAKKGGAGGETLLEGEFPKEVRADESTWSIEDSNLFSLHLEKSSQDWWPHVLTKDPKIDTTKLVPENSKLSDLDGETRAMVEKMMFDNQQKQMGKPTSDEMRQQEILKNFQAQHPEMDFSQAKIGGGFPGGA